MTIEFTSNCYAISLLESACSELVKKGAAKSIKDTRTADFETGRYIHDNTKREELQDKGFDICVYRHYLIRIKTAPVHLPRTADIRFWYDKRINRAGIKLQSEALMAIMQSVTVVEYLQKLNVQLGGSDGDLALDKVADALTETLFRAKPDSARMRFEAKGK